MPHNCMFLLAGRAGQASTRHRAIGTRRVQRAVPGIEPGTSCTRSRNHTTRPNSHGVPNFRSVMGPGKGKETLGVGGSWRALASVASARALCFYGPSFDRASKIHTCLWHRTGVGTVRVSIVVSISACHADDPGSIPGRGIRCAGWVTGVSAPEVRQNVKHTRWEKCGSVRHLRIVAWCCMRKGGDVSSSVFVVWRAPVQVASSVHICFCA